jgi:uncharacterized membrane protein
MSQQTILTVTRQLDRRGAALHLTAMMFVAFMPFSTAMLGRYISSGFAMSLYFGNQTIVSLLLCLAWLREKRNGNVGELPAEAEKKITLKTVSMTAVLFGAAVVAFFNPQYAFLGTMPGILATRFYRQRAGFSR